MNSLQPDALHLIKLSPFTFPFSLDLCLNSGQSFAWKRAGGFWAGSIGKTGFLLKQTKQGIQYFSTDSAPTSSKILKSYFALGEN